jgi:hypothetical protein
LFADRYQRYHAHTLKLRNLGNAQRADIKGKKISASATDGSVLWLRLDNVPVMGRVAVITRHGGMASSYDCCLCGCPGQYNYTVLVPVITCPITVAVGDQIHAQVWFTPACGGSAYYSDMTTGSSWSSTNTSVFTLNNTSPKGLLTSVGVGSAFANTQGPTECHAWYMMGGVCQCSNWTAAVGNTPCNVDSLVFSITSGGAPNDASGVVSRAPFNLRIQAKTPSGTVPDTFFSGQNVTFTLLNKNTSVGELAPSSVNFGSGTANANVTIVQASGLGNSVRQIVVSANATGNVFFPYAYMNVIATREGLVGKTTACGHTIQANDHFVALPYGQALCGQGIHLAYGQNQQDTSVQEVGPWCPHSSATQDNPCVCSADSYWLGTGIPYAQTHACSSNGAGIDLADGTFYDLGLSDNAPIDWKFP